MQKFSLAALAIAASAIAAPAFAQSSVTIFGVLDVAVRSVDNGSTQYQLASSGLTTSRLGFRGVEDLGGGLKANFWLEGGLNVDDGTGAAAGGGMNWQRRATVGLQGNFGEIRMGREKNPTGLTWEQLDPFSDTGLGAVGGLQNTAAADPSFSRSSNAVSYYTPSNAFFGAVMVAAGEGTLGNKHVGGRVGYNAGNLLAVVSYGETQLTSAIDVKRLTAGLTYDLKVAKLYGMYSKTEAGAADQDNYLVGVQVPVGAFVLRASYQKAEGDGSVNNRDAEKYAIGGQYNLSRRTAVYANYADISNSGGSTRQVAATLPAGTAAVANRDSTGYEIGLRHAF